MNCVLYLLSRKRPGENPVSWCAESIGDALAKLLRRSRNSDFRFNPL